MDYVSMNKLIVGFGALNLDLIYEVDDLRTISTSHFRLEPGKELFGSGEEFQSLLNPLNRLGTLKSRSGGGSAANTIAALARMGLSAKFIGKVGEDAEGDFLLENLKPAQTDLICRGAKSGVCPAIPVEVVDNTGAGDVYNAGFIAGLFLGKSLEESAMFATKVAGKSVTGYGRDRYPTEEDLKNFFH